jgi:hypothetical protein
VDPLNLLAQILLRLPRPIPKNTPIALFLTQRRISIQEQLENTETIFGKERIARTEQRRKQLDEKFVIDLAELNDRLEQWDLVKKQCANEAAADNMTLVTIEKNSLPLMLIKIR